MLRQPQLLSFPDDVPLQVQRDEREGTGMDGWNCAQLHSHHNLPFPCHSALKPATDAAAAQATTQKEGADNRKGGPGSEHTSAPPPEAPAAIGAALLGLAPVQRLHASLIMTAQLCDHVGALLCSWVPPDVVHREMRVSDARLVIY